MPPVTQEQINNQDMSTQELSQRLGGQTEPKTQTSVGMETPTQTANRARQMVQPTVDASDLAAGTRGVTVPEPQQGNIPAGPLNVARNVSRNAQGFIEAQTAEQERLRELQETYGALGEQESLSEVFQQQREQFGATPETLQELEDIQLRLNDMNTESALTQTRIQNAPGQTKGAAQREVTQEQRENAVRTAGLASRASVLQGNIETARQLANDAVDIEYQDRQLEAQNLLQQIDMVQGQVDNQTEQLLEQEKRQYEQELAQIQEVKDNVANAMVSGATQSEIAQLTSDQMSDEEKIALAQQITARGEREMRDLEMEQAEASILASELSAAKSAEQLKQLRNPTEGTRPTQVIDVNGTKQLVDTQTGEVINTFGPDTSSNEIQVAKDTAFVNSIDTLKNHSGMNSAVGPVGIARIGVADAFGAKDEFIGSVENVVKNLTLNTFAEAKEKGMTFGAMSQGEWDILGESASKIAQWRNRDDQGNVTGYDISESAFNEELDKLSNFAKMDALREGASPTEIGVQIMEDGTYWTQNSDGSYTQLDIKPQ